MRPFLGEPIDRLEMLAADDRVERGTLLSLRDEIAHRTTHRAARLRALLDNRLASDPLPFAGVDGDALSATPDVEARQLDLPLPALDWSVRAASVLRSLGVETVRDLSRCTEADLLRQRNCGRRTAFEVGARLRGIGLSLAVEPASEAVLSPVLKEHQAAALDVGVTTLSFSTRARNCLDARGIRTLGELCRVTEAELMRLPNMGRKTLAELKDALARFDLRLGMALDSRRPAEAGPMLPPGVAAPPEPALLVEALWSRVVAVTGGGRNARWTVEHLGWDGAPGRTLEQIGAPDGVTRERVRQVVAKACKRLAERRFVPEALRRALALIDLNGLLGTAELDALLRDGGLADAPFHPAGLREAATAFELPFPYAVVDVGAGWLLLPNELAGLPTKLLQVAREVISGRGSVGVEQACSFAETLAGRAVTPEVAAAVLRSDPSFAPLRDSPDWWWRPESANAGRNRLLNLARKVVAAAGSVTLRDLRDAVRRQPRTGFYAPPLGVMRALLAEQPDLEIESDDRVSAAARGLDTAEHLSSWEQRLLAIFRETGPVIDGTGLTRLATAAGLNANSLALHKSYSPLLWQPARGFFALVGSDIPVGLIEELQSRSEHARGARVDSGWTVNHQLFLCRRLSEAMADNGMISFPSALAPALAGRWELQAPFDGRHIVVARGSVLFGLRDWLRWQSAEPGDTLAMTFDPQNRRGRAWLGPPALADEIAADGFDRFHARASAEADEEDVLE